jgi:hypothetical protein
LIRRFGSGPIEVSDALAKQYIDRNQAIKVREVVVKDEETGEVKKEVVGDLEELEETPEPDSQDESPPDEEEKTPETEEDAKDQDDEEKVEIKIKRKKKKS